MSENQALGPAYYVGQITIVAVFSLLASVTVILRFWARRIQKMALDLNDYLIVPGLVGVSLLNMSTFVRLITSALCFREFRCLYIW